MKVDLNLFFKPQRTFPTGCSCSNLAVGDLNRDDFLDIIVSSSEIVSVLMGYGNGSFSLQTTFSLGSNSYAYEIALGDLNQDQILDMVLAGDNISVLMGYGNGSFAPQTTFSLGSNSYAIALEDLNQDQILDMVWSGANVSVFIGYGNGSFTPPTTVSIFDAYIRAIALADLNQDHHLDILGTSTYRETVCVFIGYGNGSFASQRTFPVGGWPSALALGDLNQDQQLDMVVANGNDNTISVLMGYGNGSLTPQRTFSLQGVGDIGLGDMNQDQRLDIVLTNPGRNTISVLISSGNGEFLSQEQTLPVGKYPESLLIADFNRDTRPDVVTVNSGDNTLSVLLSNPTISQTPSATLTSTSTTHSTRSTTRTRSSTPTLTNTAHHYDTLNPISNIYYPHSRTSIIYDFNPGLSKIDLSRYPNVNYKNLRTQQIGDDAIVHFFYDNIFLFFLLSFNQAIEPSYFLFLPSNLSEANFIFPVNNTNINFNPSQNKIDLSLYNISYQAIQTELINGNTKVIFHYLEPGEIVLHQAQASNLGESNFIFFTPILQSTFDIFIKWVKLLAGPVPSAFSTALGMYLKRGLLQNIFYASDCWKSGRYIKEEVWIPEDENEKRELCDRHGKPIPMRDVNNIVLFTLSNENALPWWVRCQPNYYIQCRQSEPINPKLVTVYPVSGKAWIKLNTGVLNEIEVGSFFTQIIAKSGAILEQFECSLENLNSEYGAFSLDISGAPEEAGSATASGSENPSSVDADQSKTVLSSIYCAQIQWSNPILQNYPLLQWAHRVGGPEGVDGLIDLGTDSHRYQNFKHLEQTMGTQKAIEWMLGSDAEPVSAVVSDFARPVSHSNLFWVGMVAYRLPMAYDQTKYLLKTTGLDLDAFYEDQGLTTFVNPIGSILRPSLLLGGATLAYCTSSDPLVLLVAANQPGFSSNSDLLANGIHYLTTILSFARAYASPSAYTVPLVVLQGTNLLSHLLVDTGLVAEDNYLIQFMQSATSLASETLGLLIYPDLPIKALQGISLLVQGLHCAELAGEYINPYFAYAQAEGTMEASQTEVIFPQEITDFA